MNTVTTDPRPRDHTRCFVCQPGRVDGLQLRCGLNEEGVAVACFECDAAFEGYDGLLHGGITAALLDGIMTNCLFLHGHAAVTADLRIRYRKPVLIGHQAVLRARLVERREPLLRLKAELAQDGITKATAQATFFLRAKR